MAITLDRFKQITGIVIDKLEGGYYHPNMLKDGRVKDSRYGNSGETMFGIDRLKGGTINTSDAGKRFWALIDNANARNTWKWNYMGGNLAPKLKDLTAEMIYSNYVSWSKLYMTLQTQQLVDSDPRLVFHFIYATWNGPGWFKKFAQDMNAATAKGIKNTDKLVEIALDSRIKEGLKKGEPPVSLIKQGGLKIAGFIDTLKGGLSGVTKGGAGVSLVIIGVVFIAMSITGYFLYIHKA